MLLIVNSLFGYIGAGEGCSFLHICPHALYNHVVPT